MRTKVRHAPPIGSGHVACQSGYRRLGEWSKLPILIIMTNKKTKRLYIRLTEEELEAIREKSFKFSNMSAFIKEAVKEFSNSSIKENLELRKELTDTYKRLDEKLAHVGGNLNQAMRRINESAKAGYPFDAILKNDFMPNMHDTYNLCMEIRKQLFEITSKYAKGR